MDVEYTSGLYCHAVSDVLVRLPEPAEQVFRGGWRRQQQSDLARAAAALCSRWKWPARKCSVPNSCAKACRGCQIDVPLDGAREFVLKVSDGGDGIGCDQADWADARVTLADGKEVALGDLPLLDTMTAPFSTDPPFSFAVDGKPSAELLKNWKRSHQVAPTG